MPWTPESSENFLQRIRKDFGINDTETTTMPTDVEITDTALLDWLERRVFESFTVSFHWCSERPKPYEMEWWDKSRERHCHYGSSVKEAILAAILNPDEKAENEEYDEPSKGVQRKRK